MSGGHNFMKINLNVANTHVERDFSEDLQIPEDPEELVGELRRYPSMFFYYSNLAEVAKRELEKVKGQYEMWYAEKYLECKKSLIAEYGKSGVTETMIKAQIYEKYGAEVTEKTRLIEEAEYKKSVLSIAANSVREKGQAMVNTLSWVKQQLRDSEH